MLCLTAARRRPERRERGRAGKPRAIDEMPRRIKIRCIRGRSDGRGRNERILRVKHGSEEQDEGSSEESVEGFHRC